jgi:hypothetical protein
MRCTAAAIRADTEILRFPKRPAGLYASSDTCPSGSPNSNVFSVIDTMV